MVIFDWLFGLEKLLGLVESGGSLLPEKLLEKEKLKNQGEEAALTAALETARKKEVGNIAAEIKEIAG